MEESKKQPVVSTTYTSPASSVSMSHQWHNSEVKASTSSVNASGSHFCRDASGIITPSRVERPQFKSDMHTGASQGPAVPAGNYFGNTTSWSAQPHSNPATISFGTPSDSKVHVQSSSRITDPSFRPFMSHTPPGTFQAPKGVAYGQTSSPSGNNNHAEIAKIVHKVLQPPAKQNLLWNPPSREYMNKATPCHMCRGAINEVDTLLICDACEKGYHLKCLQTNNMKGVPKSEWHCPRCVQLYNGKSFPPKYGRVMRSGTTEKMSSSTSEVQSPAENKVGRINLKVNQAAMPHPAAAKPTVNSGMYQTIEAKDTSAINLTVEAKDTATMNQTVQAGDGAPINGAAITQTIEAEDASTNQAVDTNNEPQGLVGNNDAECDDPSEPVTNSETLDTPKPETKEDPSKDVIDGSVSVNSQDNNPKIVVEPSLQEENSDSQTENLPSQPLYLQSNTDHSQQQDTTPNVEENIQKNVTENPQVDQSS
ncbi:unnamed protein product [Cochlearia groenlandica]